MQSAQRFKFDRCFDGRLQDLGDAADRPNPLYTADDVAGARAQGYAEGHASACAAAEAQRQAFELRLDQTLGAMTREMGSLLEQTNAATAEIGRQAALVAAAVGRKLLPRLYRENACAEIEDFITRTFQQLPSDRPVTVRIATASTCDLASRIAAAAAANGLEKSVRMLGDGSMAEGDCRIEWAGGGVLRDQERLWREIEALIDDVATPRLPAPALRLTDAECPATADQPGEDHA